MNNDYIAMQSFLDLLKEFAISNPNKQINDSFVYSNLIRFGIEKTQLIYQNVDLTYYEYWKARYKNSNNMQVSDEIQDSFCWFLNSYNVPNSVKMYIPMDYDHVKDGACQLFDFISSLGIVHQSKIAPGIRNDNVVVRVNSLEDAKKIADFVSSNSYIQQGMLKVNPFLPKYNNIGVVMDNEFSFNSELSNLLSNFIETLRKYNKLECATVEEFNKFITNEKNKVNNSNLKDIYNLLEKTTQRNFQFEQFIDHAENKLIDDYDKNRKKIVDPKHYFERAIFITEKYYKYNSKQAIIYYLNGISDYFTRKENARGGLEKYVKPGDVINIMRSKLQENNIQIPSTDEELINKYLSVLLSKQNNYNNEFEIIKNAYINTKNKYDEEQANIALKSLYLYKDVGYFTNQYGDRTKLLNSNILKDSKRIILSNIDINNINVNNFNDVLNRFKQTLQIKNNIK